MKRHELEQIVHSIEEANLNEQLYRFLLLKVLAAIAVSIFELAETWASKRVRT